MYAPGTLIREGKPPLESYMLSLAKAGVGAPGRAGRGPQVQFRIEQVKSDRTGSRGRPKVGRGRGEEARGSKVRGPAFSWRDDANLDWVSPILVVIPSAPFLAQAIDQELGAKRARAGSNAEAMMILESARDAYVAADGLGLPPDPRRKPVNVKG